MAIKRGDKVIIRQDLLPGELYGKIRTVESDEMTIFSGKTVTVTGFPTANSVTIEEDKGRWLWSKDMFSVYMTENPEIWIIKIGDRVRIKPNLQANTKYGIIYTDVDGIMASLAGSLQIVRTIDNRGRLFFENSSWAWSQEMLRHPFPADIPATLEDMRKERIMVIGVETTYLTNLQNFLVDIGESVVSHSIALQEGQDIHTVFVLAATGNWCGGGSTRATINLSEFLEKYAHLLSGEKSKPKRKDPLMDPYNIKPCIINYNIKDKNNLAMQVARNVHAGILQLNHVNADIIESGYTQVASDIHATMIDVKEYNQRIANWDIKYIALWDICKQHQDRVHNFPGVEKGNFASAGLKSGLMISWHALDRYIKKPAKNHDWILGMIKANLVENSSILYKSNNILVKFNKSNMSLELQTRAGCYDAALQYKTGEFSL